MTTTMAIPEMWAPTKPSDFIHGSLEQAMVTSMTPPIAMSFDEFTDVTLRVSAVLRDALDEFMMRPVTRDLLFIIGARASACAHNSDPRVSRSIRAEAIFDQKTRDIRLQWSAGEVDAARWKKIADDEFNSHVARLDADRKVEKERVFSQYGEKTHVLVPIALLHELADAAVFCEYDPDDKAPHAVRAARNILRRARGESP
jgi:hypothetical protein